MNKSVKEYNVMSVGERPPLRENVYDIVTLDTYKYIGATKTKKNLFESP